MSLNNTDREHFPAEYQLSVSISSYLYLQTVTVFCLQRRARPAAFQETL